MEESREEKFTYEGVEYCLPEPDLGCGVSFDLQDLSPKVIAPPPSFDTPSTTSNMLTPDAVSTPTQEIRTQNSPRTSISPNRRHFSSVARPADLVEG